METPGAVVQFLFIGILWQQVFLTCGDKIPLTYDMISSSSQGGYWRTTWASAVDGNIRQDADKCLCCGLSNKENDPYIRIDLRKHFKLSQIVVYGRSDRSGNHPLDTLQTLHIYVHNYEADKGDPVFIESSSSVLNVTTDLSPSKLGHYVTLQLQGTRFLVICEIVIVEAPCPAFHYGPNCSMPCGKCKPDEQCDILTGYCSHCEAGYQLPLCINKCNPGTYGEDCKNMCGRCKYPDVCDSETGICPLGCEKGYQATDLCTAECDDFTYGYNCTHSCGNCSDNSPCNKSDGHCVSCAPGFQGPLCNNTCVGSYYGNCSTPCGHCKGGIACDKATGHCEHGCETGFKISSLCDKQCDDFSYGYNCTHSCGNCSDNNPCNKSDGHCDMCVSGYQGMLCDKTCPDHYYGNCSTPCGHCKGGIACDKATGNCEHGCESGFKNTSLCDKRLEKLVDTDTSSQTIVGVAAGVTAALVVAAVVMAALVLYHRRGRIAKKSPETNCSPNAFDNVVDVPEQSIVYAKPTRKSRDSVGTHSAEPATKEKSQPKKVRAKDEHEYYNSAPIANALKVFHLWSYIHEKKADDCKMFYEEFKESINSETRLNRKPFGDIYRSF